MRLLPYLRIQSWNDLQRILIIQLLEYMVWQIEAIHSPIGVIALVVWEVLIR